MNNFNTTLFLRINGYGAHTPFVGWWSLFFSSWMMYALLVVVVLLPLMFFFKEQHLQQKLHYLHMWLMYVGVGCATWFVVSMLKVLTNVARPYEAITTLHPLITSGLHNSFPSLHSALAVAIASVTALWSRKLSDVLYLFALLIMLSRIFIGVHYPFDVIVGALIGWGIAYCGKRFYYGYLESRT